MTKADSREVLKKNKKQQFQSELNLISGGKKKYLRNVLFCHS